MGPVVPTNCHPLGTLKRVQHDEVGGGDGSLVTASPPPLRQRAQPFFFSAHPLPIREQLFRPNIDRVQARSPASPKGRTAGQT